MYSVLNTLSEYIYFYISSNIASYNFLFVFKIVESLQCILKIYGEYGILQESFQLDPECVLCSLLITNEFSFNFKMESGFSKKLFNVSATFLSF